MVDRSLTPLHPSSIFPLPIPLCLQSNNGHKSFHMPSVWSAAAAPPILTHSGQGISTGNAIFYFRADRSLVLFFLGQPELSPFCLSVCCCCCLFPFVLSTVSGNEFNNLRQQKAQKKKPNFIRKNIIIRDIIIILLFILMLFIISHVVVHLHRCRT